MPEFTPFNFDPTAFMSGQVGSKLWLCEMLEPILKERFPNNPPDIWVLGGWYGMTNFLLQSRDAHLNTIKSIDVDPEATRGALILNEAYVHLQTFQAETADANTLDYSNAPLVVINTSAEHMESRQWFEIIPKDTLVVVQTNDMPHDDHVFAHHSIEDLKNEFPMSGGYYFAGELPFFYDDWSFTRFMTIGIK